MEGGHTLLHSVKTFIEQDVLQLSGLAPIIQSQQEKAAALHLPVPGSVSAGSDAEQQQSLPLTAQIQRLGCEILVEGFELFYPLWKHRLSRLLSLLRSASSSAPASGLSARILSLLSTRYQQAHLGLRWLPSAALDLSLLSSPSQQAAESLLQQAADTDAANARRSVEARRGQRSRAEAGLLSYGGRTEAQHPATYVLLAFQSQLLLLCQVDGAATRSE